jgi:hypothetical protein
MIFGFKSKQSYIKVKKSQVYSTFQIYQSDKLALDYIGELVASKRT